MQEPYLDLENGSSKHISKLRWKYLGEKINLILKEADSYSDLCIGAHVQLCFELKNGALCQLTGPLPVKVLLN